MAQTKRKGRCMYMRMHVYVPAVSGRRDWLESGPALLRTLNRESRAGCVESEEPMVGCRIQ